MLCIGEIFDLFNWIVGFFLYLVVFVVFSFIEEVVLMMILMLRVLVLFVRCLWSSVFDFYFEKLYNFDRVYKLKCFYMSYLDGL